MNLDNLNKWLTLLANVGVVVGIFALITELNHSSRLAEVSAFQSRMTEIQGAQVEIATSEGLAVLLEKYETEGIEALSPIELRRVRAWHNGAIRRRQSQYYQYQQGFLERFQIDDMLDNIASGTYEKWQELGLLSLIQLPEWREEIEARIESRSSQ